MKEIKAFVGHSFTKEDDILVRCFLDYFNELKEALPHFSWEHAKPAESKDLSDKVMSIISDKNVFIGICTKKELVCTGNTFWGKLGKKVWKTSDWIIQEIGLSIGLGLDLILLVEKGIRQPGGLQGNLNYIEFDRLAPEKSFQEILEMIRSISPKQHSSLIATSGEPIKKDDDHPLNNLENPTPEWNRIMYEFSFMHMVATDNSDGMERINQAYLNTAEAALEDNKITWEAECELSRLYFNKGGNLYSIQDLSNKHPKSSGIWGCLARAYEHFNAYEDEINAYRKEFQLITDEVKKLGVLNKICAAYLRVGDADKAYIVINEMKSILPLSKAGEITLLNSLKDYAEYKKDNCLLLGVLEREAELDPSNINTRFSLAYKHSQSENKDLALFHYLKIPPVQRDHMAWNNIGVSYDEFELPAKAVNAYRKAAESNETLAMSNLANKFLKEGFLKEAQKECDEALKIPEYNKNILISLKSLKEKVEIEDDKEKELIKNAKPISDFYSEFGKHLLLNKAKSLTGSWINQDIVLSVTLQDNKFNAKGVYEVSFSGLGGLFSGFGLGGAKPSPVKYEIEYEGRLTGHAIEGTVIREKEGERKRSTLLDMAEKQSKIIMIISDDENEIRVMERVKENAPIFYNLKRKV